MDSVKLKDLADELAKLNSQVKTTTNPETLAQLKARQTAVSLQLKTAATSFKTSMKSASQPIREEPGNELGSKPKSACDSQKDAKVNLSSSSTKATQKSKEMTSSKKVEEAKANDLFDAFLKSEPQKEAGNSLKQTSSTPSIDLCFLIDGTSSMQPWIDQTKDKVREIIRETQKHYVGFQFRVGAVVYRDFDMGSQSFEIQPFVQEASQVETFLSQIRARGGGDFPEDVNGGLQKVLSLEWRSPIKILTHFADAPGHGPEFYDGEDLHKYPPSDMHWDKIFGQLRSLSIEYNFLKVSDITDKMTGKFAKYWQNSEEKASKQGKKLEFNVYPVSVAGQDLVNKIKSSIKSSIQRSIRSMSNSDEILKAALGSVTHNDADVFAQLKTISQKSS